MPFLHERSFVVPEDIKAVAVFVLAHRLVLSRGVGSQSTGTEIIEKLLSDVAVPTENWGKTRIRLRICHENTSLLAAAGLFIHIAGFDLQNFLGQKSLCLNPLSRQGGSRRRTSHTDRSY